MQSERNSPFVAQGRREPFAGWKVSTLRICHSRRVERSLRDIGVVAGADPHRVMPCQRKCPPHKTAKDCLAKHERKNVSVAREKPAHCGPSGKGERNQHRIGPNFPLHFTAFHPDFKLRDKPPTPPETLHRARNLKSG